MEALDQGKQSTDESLAPTSFLRVASRRALLRLGRMAAGIGLAAALPVLGDLMPLFSEEPKDAPFKAAAVSDETGFRSVRLARLNPAIATAADSALRNPAPAFQKKSSSRIQLNLSAERSYVAVIEKTDSPSADQIIARGVIEGVPHSSVVLSQAGEAMAGSIVVPGEGTWQIQYVGDGEHRIAETDPLAPQPCDAPVPQLPPVGAAEIPPMAGNNAVTVLDVMFVYTPAARAGAGGVAGITALINSAIAEANDAYTRSGINARLNLVHAAEVAYTESGNAQVDLPRLQNPSDGQMDTVPQLRNQFGADIVCLLTESMASYAGLGYVMPGLNPSFASHAYSVVRRVYANGFFVVAHEIGHNLGCMHDRQNSSNAGALPHSYGHRFSAGGVTYRTVMAYDPGQRIPHFSNPQVTFNGTATGIASGQANSADNANTINQTAPVAANFRGTVTVIQFNTTTAAVAEDGSSVTLTVTRDGDLTRSAQVNFATANLTATAGADYTARSGTLVFDVGDTEKTLTIPITNDSSVEADETFRCTLSAPVGASVGSRSQVQVTIREDDAALALVATSATVIEGGASARLEVRRRGGLAGQSSFAYTTAAGTATSDVDFTAASDTVTFGAGETNKFIFVAITDDAAFEPNETLFVRFGGATGAVFTGLTNATVTIADNDTRVALTTNAVAVAENAGRVSLLVTRSGGLAATAAVTFATAEDTAAAGTDFVAATGTITFGPNETSKVITLTINNDNRQQGNRTFRVLLTDPRQGAQLTGIASATVTILDNDSTIRFAAAEDRVLEGAVTRAIVVNRLGGLASAATVRYTVAAGTATSGADYSAASGLLTFNAGQSSRSIPVSILNDVVVENDEALTVTLSAPAGEAVLGDITTHTLTITDNDQFVVRLASNNVTANEADGAVTLTVTRQGTLTNGATVLCTTRDDTARAGLDYTALNTTLTFAPDEDSKTVTVNLINDTVVEATERFRLTLSSLSAGGVPGGSLEAIINITEDDAGLTFAVVATNVVESFGEVTLAVRRTGNTNSAVSTDYITRGLTALAETDFEPVTGTVSFDPGDVLKTFTVPIVDDVLVEPNETFAVVLTNAPGARLLTPTNMVVTIIEDDSLVSFAGTNFNVLENGTRATVSLRRTGGTVRAASVTVATADRTATAGEDYTATQTVVRFLPGETTRTLTIPLLNDSVIETNEIVGLDLSVVEGTQLGSVSNATVTIVDNDSRLSLQTSSYEVNEGTGRITVSVLREGSVVTPASVRFQTLNGTALATSDYGAVSSVLTFNPGERSKPLVILLRNDTTAESAEAFDIVLMAPTGEAQLGSLARSTITVTDNDGGAGAQAPDLLTVSMGHGPDGVPMLRVQGREGAEVEILTATNLQDWQPAARVSLTNGVLEWIPQDTSSSSRLYRVQEVGQ
jgi:hypothetical protein